MDVNFLTRRRLFWLSVLLALFLLACGGSGAARTATPNPLSKLVILDTSCEYIASLGDWLCTGQVRNDGTATLRFVEIRVTLSANGAQVGTDTSYIDSDRLPAGASSAWSVYVSDPNGATRKPSAQATIEGGSIER